MQNLGYAPHNKLKIRVVARDTGAYRRAGVSLIGDLRAIFVEAELENVSTKEWHSKLARRDFRVAINRTGQQVDDPDINFYENYYCGSSRNYSHYCNPEVDRMIDRQSSELDAARRLRLVHAIDRKLQEEFARPIIFHQVNFRARHPYVKGFQFHHGIYNSWRFQDVWLDK
jgi:peptide/nickel transport system substrate-binding protein